MGGLPGDLTIGEFRAYFEQFGSIKDIVVMCDKETSRPRGFGFVTYDSHETANNVVKNRFYELKNKRVEVKKAVSKELMSRKFGNYFDTYDMNVMYNIGNFGAYYYRVNDYYRYGAYICLGYDGLSYVYYPYQSPNPSYYTNTYSYQSSYNYGNTQYSNNYSHNYGNRTPVLVKKISNVKDGEDSAVPRKNVSSIQDKGETEVGNLRERVANDEENVVKHVLENGDGDYCEISEGLNLCCNGDGDGGCAEVIEALSL